MQQKNLVIASANLIVIRPGEKVLSEYIQIFLESPVGLVMLKSFQRGSTVVNLNHTDLLEMDIPMLPMDRQREIVQLFREESLRYRRTVAQAAARLNEQKDKLYEQMI